MEKKCLIAKNGPPAVGPYSHAVRVGQLLFVSGQGPFNRDGSGPIQGSFEEQVRYTLENLKVVLNDCGSDLSLVVKTTVFLVDMGLFSEFNRIYKEYFPTEPPARSCVEVSNLPGGIMVEIEAVAICKD